MERQRSTPRGVPSLTARSPATRLVVLGGFLGAGKTTALLRLAERHAAAGRRVGVVTNDQGDDLVDTRRFREQDLPTLEVPGGCFCCRFDEFVARMDELLETARPDVILAEPVGSCTDLVATVLEPLRRRGDLPLSLAPFAVLLDPLRALAVLGGGTTRLSEKVTYILRLQQQEADAVAISKLDLLGPGQQERVEALVRERFPGVPVLAFSARTGEGVDEVAELLDRERPGPGRPLAEIDYDVYAAGEAELGWLNRSATFEARGALVALDEALLALGRELARRLASAGVEAAHAKLLARGDRHSAVVSLAGEDADPELAQSSGERTRRLDLMANLRVQAEPARVEAALDDALAAWAARLDLAPVEAAGRAFRPPRPVPTHRIPTP